jgi:hypothetical protein
MIIIFLSVGLFLGFMIPTLLASIMPGLTIKILELFRLYPRGTLNLETTTYITGAGYYRQGKVFMYRDGSGTERFDNGRVFGYLMLIFIPIFFIISTLAFFVFRIFF